MMILREYISILSGAVFLLGFFPYLRTILQGKTRPAKATWTLWAIIDIITLLGMQAEKSLNGHIIAATFGAALVALLSLRYGQRGWTRVDLACMSGAIMAILAWIIWDSPVSGILFCQIVNAIGAVPTFQSILRNPENEDPLSWRIFWISGLLAISAMPQWSLEDSLQPLTFFSISTLNLTLFLYPKYRRLLTTTTDRTDK